MHSVWLALADGIAAVHYAFLVYLAVGGFIAWRWRGTIALHVLAAVWGILVILTKVPCPLTALQNHFREDAGDHPLSSSFINVYVRGTLYPAHQQTLSQALVAAVVLVSWVGFRRLGQRTNITTDATA